MFPIPNMSQLGRLYAKPFTEKYSILAKSGINYSKYEHLWYKKYSAILIKEAIENKNKKKQEREAYHSVAINHFA